MVSPISASWTTRGIKTGRRLSGDADHVIGAVPRCSAFDSNIAARRILNRSELAPTDLPGWHPLPVLRLAPGLPVRPPRARMLFGVFEPGLEFSRGQPAGPVLIPVPSRRVHNPGDMAPTRNDKPDRTTKDLCTEEHRPRWCNMVLPSRQVVNRDLHLREVEGDPAHLDAPLREIIVDVAAT